MKNKNFLQISFLIFTYLLCFLSSTLLAQSSKKKTIKSIKPIRVLFIGNSFTYVCNTPGILGELCAQKKIAIQTGMSAPGGCTLRGHCENPNTLKALEEKWDWVFIQAQSQEPALTPFDSIKHAQRLHDLAVEKGAKVVVFNTWGYRDVDSKKFDLLMHNQLCKTYCEMAIKFNCNIAPCGPAWKVINEKYPNIDLYQPNDGNCHQSIRGAYLNACIFFKIITQKSPVGLPSKGKTFNITNKDAQILQKVANETVNTFSPKEFLSRLETEDQKLPEAEFLKTTLKIGMSRPEVEKIIGQPEQSNPKENLHIYKLQKEKQAWIRYDSEEKIINVSIDFWQLKK